MTVYDTHIIILISRSVDPLLKRGVITLNLPVHFFMCTIIVYVFNCKKEI